MVTGEAEREERGHEPSEAEGGTEGSESPWGSYAMSYPG